MIIHDLEAEAVCDECRRADLERNAVVSRGTVEAIDDAVVVVRIIGSDHLVTCETMEAHERVARPLDYGDHVLVWCPSTAACDGIVLGRIGAAAAPAEPEPSGPPDELVIEAKQSLTLRVGDGSITIREDGRILIKGRELVSHAKGMNRIRGGSVAIN